MAVLEVDGQGTQTILEMLAQELQVKGITEVTVVSTAQEAAAVVPMLVPTVLPLVAAMGVLAQMILTLGQPLHQAAIMVGSAAAVAAVHITGQEGMAV